MALLLGWGVWRVEWDEWRQAWLEPTHSPPHAFDLPLHRPTARECSPWPTSSSFGPYCVGTLARVLCISRRQWALSGRSMFNHTPETTPLRRRLLARLMPCFVCRKTGSRFHDHGTNSKPMGAHGSLATQDCSIAALGTWCHCLLAGQVRAHALRLTPEPEGSALFSLLRTHRSRVDPPSEVKDCLQRVCCCRSIQLIPLAVLLWPFSPSSVIVSKKQSTGSPPARASGSRVAAVLHTMCVDLGLTAPRSGSANSCALTPCLPVQVGSRGRHESS